MKFTTSKGTYKVTKNKWREYIIPSKTNGDEVKYLMNHMYLRTSLDFFNLLASNCTRLDFFNLLAASNCTSLDFFNLLASNSAFTSSTPTTRTVLELPYTRKYGSLAYLFFLFFIFNEKWGFRLGHFETHIMW